MGWDILPVLERDSFTQDRNIERGYPHLCWSTWNKQGLEEWLPQHLQFHSDEACRCILSAPSSPHGFGICMWGYSHKPFDWLGTVWNLVISTKCSYIEKGITYLGTYPADCFILFLLHMWQPQVEIVLLSSLLCPEIQLKSQNSNCVNCDYFTQNGSWAILGKIVIVDTIRILTF
jgi:hypothetical protein